MAALCRLLSEGKLRAPKGECILTLDDLLRWQEGLLLVVMPPHPGRIATGINLPKKCWNDSLAREMGGPGEIPRERFKKHLPTSPDEILSVLKPLAAIAPQRVWLGAFMPYRGNDLRRLQKLSGVAHTASVPLLATNDILYHTPERRELQDVITCIREHVTLEEAGRLLEVNAERYLKPPKEMASLFRDFPEAIYETIRFANRITFSLDQLKYNYPDEPVPKGKSAQQHLEDLTWEGAANRYPKGLPDKVRETLEQELRLIDKMQIAPYFLTVYDIVSFARSKDILCQGRGSAANSAVCYVLGITAVDPAEIDVDFEHERREEVIQHIYQRYGHHRAALTATVICYRPRSAIREAGKVFGLTEDVTAALASGVWGSWGSELKDKEVRQGAYDTQNPIIARAMRFANELMGFPRHLSQH